MNARKPRVNFLIAGVQKGGTTALAQYLNQHPDLWIPTSKELHFFDDESINWAGNLAHHYHHYEAQFEPASERQLCGEATPIYTFWWPAMSRIWHYNNQMRFIIILRNPIDRAYSHWTMEYNRHLDIRDFESALELEPERCRLALPHQHRIFSYISRGYYSEQLRRLWTFFPQQHTLIILQEELRSAPSLTLSKIHRFLGLDERSTGIEVRANMNSYASQMSEKARELLKKIFTPEIAQLELMLKKSLRHWLSE